jgi:hypothetical protein
MMYYNARHGDWADASGNGSHDLSDDDRVADSGEQFITCG